MSRGPQGVRYAEVERETRMTRVQVVLDLDGGVRQDVSTGVKLLDHLVESMAKHGAINLGVKAESDADLDDYHLLADLGFAVGRAIREALRDAEPIVRYASKSIPVDNALVHVALDVAGKGSCYFDMGFDRESIGGVHTQNLSKFFQSVCSTSGMTVHVRKESGDNDYCVCEALFIGFGLALGEATRISEKPNGSKS